METPHCGTRWSDPVSCPYTHVTLVGWARQIRALLSQHIGRITEDSRRTHHADSPLVASRIRFARRTTTRWPRRRSCADLQELEGACGKLRRAVHHGQLQ